MFRDTFRVFAVSEFNDYDESSNDNSMTPQESKTMIEHLMAENKMLNARIGDMTRQTAELKDQIRL